MLIKDTHAIHEAPLKRPEADQKIWIDVVPDQAPSLRDVGETLGWAPEVAALLEHDPDRAQLQYLNALLICSIFVPEGDQMRSLAVVLGPGVIVTHHREPLTMLAELTHDLATKPELLDSAHFLLYEILERTSDEYLAWMDGFEETFDELEEAVLAGHDRAHEVFSLRHKLHHLRGVLADMRRIAARLSRRQFAATTDGSSDANIFIDVYDAFYHVMDNIDSLRDNLTGLVDLELNQRSTRLNEIMKFLTIFSTIFLPLSFITGFFGMNLHSMPELGVPYGQELTLLLMALVAGSMLWIFKRRKWM